EPEGVTLGRPPEHVTVSEIFDLLDGSDPGKGETVGGSEDRVSLLLQHRNHALRGAFAGVTLRTLVSEDFSLLSEAEPAEPPPESAPFHTDQTKDLSRERMH